MQENSKNINDNNENGFENQQQKEQENECNKNYQAKLQDIFAKKNKQIDSYYKNYQNEVQINSKNYYFRKHPLQLGFSSVGFKGGDEENENEIYQILQKGFIFEVVVTSKNNQLRQLEVVLQRFLAFTDKCHSSNIKPSDPDFQIFQKYKSNLSQLIKVNCMNIKAIIEESEVIEDFSMFSYYISYNKITAGDHLNAVVLQVENLDYSKKPLIKMSLKNKCILGGRMWSLQNLQDPKTYDSNHQIFFRLGYTKMIGKVFENNEMSKQEKEKWENKIENALEFKDQNNVFSLDYQIQNDVFFRNKQNYEMMLKSLKIDQFHSFCSKTNLKTFQAFNLDYKRQQLSSYCILRMSKISLGQQKSYQ